MKASELLFYVSVIQSRKNYSRERKLFKEENIPFVSGFGFVPACPEGARIGIVEDEVDYKNVRVRISKYPLTGIARKVRIESKDNMFNEAAIEKGFNFYAEGGKAWKEYRGEAMEADKIINDIMFLNNESPILILVEKNRIKDKSMDVSNIQ